MLVLVSYDVSTGDAAGRKRLRQVAKCCQARGVRVQNSVFECNVDYAQWLELKNRLEKLCDPRHDSLRYYYLGVKYRSRVEHFGAKPAIDVEMPIIV